MVNKQHLLEFLMTVGRCISNCVEDESDISRVCANCRMWFMANELRRVKEGDLTPEEFNNLCHNLEKKGRPITREEHKKECDKWRDGLFGPEPVKVSYDLELIKIQVEAAKEIIVYAIGGRSSESTQRAINAASDFLVDFFSPLKIEFDNQITDEDELMKAVRELAKTKFQLYKSSIEKKE